MYEVTNAELGRSLVRIEGKLDTVTSDHERRIRTLERWMYVNVGLAVAGATSGLGGLLAVILEAGT